MLIKYSNIHWNTTKWQLKKWHIVRLIAFTTKICLTIFFFIFYQNERWVEWALSTETKISSVSAMSRQTPNTCSVHVEYSMIQCDLLYPHLKYKSKELKTFENLTLRTEHLKWVIEYCTQKGKTNIKHVNWTVYAIWLVLPLWKKLLYPTVPYTSHR